MNLQDELLSRFSTDSWDYEILKDAAESVVNINGLSLELGVREGGSSKMMIDAFLKTPKIKRTHIALDPYGNLPYYYSTSEWRNDPGPYGNSMRDFVVPGLLLYCANTNVDFLFYQMTDCEFMKRFSDGIPVYNTPGNACLAEKYALVHIDGPHITEDTLSETIFFEERSVIGTHLVYDDVEGYYDHEQIRKYLLEREWVVKKETDKKISYVKVGK